MFELIQIKQFLQIAKCGTLLKAAEELNMTQPGLSKSMRNLERELGVTLFTHKKNRISLNENGELALQLFSSWYVQAQHIQDNLQEYERTHKTIFIGTCSPLPMSRSISKLLARCYPDISCQHTIQPCQELEQHLYDKTYQFIIVPYKPSNPAVTTVFYGEEQLYVTLPINHPLAQKQEGIYFCDLDGEPVLSLPQTGYWYDLPKKMLPHSHIIDHSELYDFEEVMKASQIPTFITTYLMEIFSYPNTRVAIPILDTCAKISYWCACLPQNEAYLKPLFSQLPCGRL